MFFVHHFVTLLTRCHRDFKWLWTQSQPKLEVQADLCALWWADGECLEKGREKHKQFHPGQRFSWTKSLSCVYKNIVGHLKY